RIGKKVLHDGAAPRRLLDREQCPARLPAILPCLLPALAVLAQADDDADAVVLHVERLPAALRPVAKDGDGLVTQDFADALRRVIGTLDHGFDSVSDANLAHDILHFPASNENSSNYPPLNTDEHREEREREMNEQLWKE